VRVGFGFDAHRLTETGCILLGGVVVSEQLGVDATSDGDVAAHAVADALLGAAALGDLGTFYPSDDPSSEGADSMAILGDVVARLGAAGLRPSSLDVTVVAEEIRIAPHRSNIRRRLAETLNVAMECVSVKATTTDGLGWVGRGEGIAASAIAVVERH